jgi:hypothetical protein
MAVVDGVEGTTEERDAARMMFCGGAVSLRGGQCVSQEGRQSSVRSFQ